MADYPPPTPKRPPAVQKQRAEIATNILAAILYREGEPHEITEIKRLGVANRAVEWADSLMAALNK